jgi:hypothetical protein
VGYGPEFPQYRFTLGRSYSFPVQWFPVGFVDPFDCHGPGRSTFVVGIPVCGVAPVQAHLLVSGASLLCLPPPIVLFSAVVFMATLYVPGRHCLGCLFGFLWTILPGYSASLGSFVSI